MRILAFALAALFLAVPLPAAAEQFSSAVTLTPCEKAERSLIERMQEQFGVKAICECKEKDGVPVLQCKADKKLSV